MFTYTMVPSMKNGRLDQKIYGTTARNGWLALITYINANNQLTEVCEGTNIKNDCNYYLQHKSIVGDLHARTDASAVLCHYAVEVFQFQIILSESSSG